MVHAVAKIGGGTKEDNGLMTGSGDDFAVESSEVALGRLVVVPLDEDETRREALSVFENTVFDDELVGIGLLELEDAVERVGAEVEVVILFLIASLAFVLRFNRRLPAVRVLDLTFEELCDGFVVLIDARVHV